METYLGIEIGGTKLQVVTGNGNAEIINRFRFTVEPAEGAEGIRKNIIGVIRDLKLPGLKCIGAGFGGPVDRNTGRIWTSYHVPGWSGFELKTWLEDLGQVPAAVDNDGNVAALGEACYGAGQSFNTVFYITLGSGVGGGMTISKKIYHGALPGETEIGHLRLDKNGRILQSSCSGWAVDEKIRSTVKTNPGGKLAELTKGMKGSEAKMLAEALRLNDADALEILTETADDLAFALSHVVHLFHPEIIVMGGGLSLLGEPLRQITEQKLTPYIMDAFRPGPVIRLSALKEDAVPVGALALAIHHPGKKML